MYAGRNTIGATAMLRFETRGMTTRGRIGAKPKGCGDADDELMRLVRTIARQAAQEAFQVFKQELDASPLETRRQVGRVEPVTAPEKVSMAGRPFTRSGRALSQRGRGRGEARRFHKNRAADDQS
jgi:hypothetical protein